MWKMIAVDRTNNDREVYTAGMETTTGVIVRNTTYIGTSLPYVGWRTTSASESMVFVEGMKLVEAGTINNTIMHKLEAL